MIRYVRLLRRRDFALLWTGATVSALGDGMSFVALVWLVLERAGDPGAVGLLAAVYSAPVVIGGLVAGIVLDRFNRRTVLAADNLVRGIAIASIPAAAALGVLTMPHLYIVAGIYGLLFMVSLAGIPTLLPTLVEPDELTTANAMESLTYGIAGLAGPALAGAVIAMVGAPVVLAIDGLSYGCFVACLVLMRDPLPPPAIALDTRVPAEPAAPGGTPTAIDEGRGLGPAIRFVLGTPAILVITLMYMAVNVGEGMFTVLAPVYARDVLGGGAVVYGLIVSAFTGGSLAGSLIVGAVDWPFPLGRSIAGALVLTGAAFLPMLVRPPLAITFVILVLAGLFASSLTTWAQTIRMRLIPLTLRGRVFALLRTLMQGTTPVGAFAGGWMLAAGAVAPVVAAIAAIVAVPGAIGLVSPALGREATGEPV